MSYALKDLYSPEFYDNFLNAFQKVSPNIDRKALLALIFDESWEQRELSKDFGERWHQRSQCRIYVFAGLPGAVWLGRLRHFRKGNGMADPFYQL